MPNTRVTTVDTCVDTCVGPLSEHKSEHKGEHEGEHNYIRWNYLFFETVGLPYASADGRESDSDSEEEESVMQRT